MNKLGGGITSYDVTQSSEMRLFSGGLRNTPSQSDRLEMAKSSTFSDHHDFLNYERGTISRSRNIFNQYLNYQYMYGGMRNYAER